MATPRIGKRELLAREKTRAEQRSNVVARALASPLGILLVFPAARELLARLRAIEVPPEQAWTEHAAHSWWQAHHPAPVVRPAGISAPPTRELSVLSGSE